VVSFTLNAIYTLGKNSRYLTGPRGGLGKANKRKISALPGVELCISQPVSIVK